MLRVLLLSQSDSPLFFLGDADVDRLDLLPLSETERWDGTSPFPVPAPPIELVDHDWFNRGASGKYGHWRMCSLGPDRRYCDAQQFSADYPCYGSDIVYDASNGTMSWGNVLRTRKRGAGTDRR